MSTKIEWCDEVWREVPGFADYFVTKNGQIRGPSGRIMRQMTMPSGHYYVLCNRGRGNQHKLFVHRAILLAFIGQPLLGQETRHLDGIPAHNNLKNLIWGTRRENQLDRIRHGTLKPHESIFTKLMPADIPIIRTMNGAGVSSRKIATKFHTSHTTIQKIIRGERWKGY